MSKYKIGLAGFMILILSISCTTVKEEHIESLEFVSLGLDENALLKPADHLLFDSLALVREFGFGGSDKLLSIIDVNQGKVIKKFLDKGNGPNEFIALGSLARYGKDHFQFSTKRKLFVFSVQDVLNGANEPKRTFDFDDIPLSREEMLLNLYILNDSLLLCTGAFKKGKFAIASIKDNKVRSMSYICHYPIDDRPEHQNETNYSKFWAYQPYMYFSQSTQKAFSSEGSGSSFELLNVGKEIKTIGYHNLFPLVYRVLSDKTASMHVSKTVDGLTFGGSISDDHIIFPYSGRTYASHQEARMYGELIYQYDWEGNLVKQYDAERDIVSLSIDEEKNRVYAITINPDTFYPEFGYFNIRL